MKILHMVPIMPPKSLLSREVLPRKGRPYSWQQPVAAVWQRCAAAAVAFHSVVHIDSASCSPKPAAGPMERRELCWPHTTLVTVASGYL